MKIHPVEAEVFHENIQAHDEANTRFSQFFEPPQKNCVLPTQCMCSLLTNPTINPEGSPKQHKVAVLCSGFGSLFPMRYELTFRTWLRRISAFLNELRDRQRWDNIHKIACIKLYVKLRSPLNYFFWCIKIKTAQKKSCNQSWLVRRQGVNSYEINYTSLSAQNTATPQPADSCKVW
jgi:hypothetical protein